VKSPLKNETEVQNGLGQQPICFPILRVIYGLATVYICLTLVFNLGR